MLIGVILQCDPSSCTLEKRRFSPLQYGQEDNIPGNWKLKRGFTDLFWKSSGCSLSHRQSRNRMINTFTIVNITLHVRDSIEDTSILVQSKNIFLLPSVWSGTDYSWALIWKKCLLIYSENYQGIPYSSKIRVGRR